MFNIGYIYVHYGGVQPNYFQLVYKIFQTTRIRLLKPIVTNLLKPKVK